MHSHVARLTVFKCVSPLWLWLDRRMDHSQALDSLSSKAAYLSNSTPTDCLGEDAFIPSPEYLVVIHVRSHIAKRTTSSIVINEKTLGSVEVEPIDTIRWAGIEEPVVFNVGQISSRASEWNCLQ